MNEIKKQTEKLYNLLDILTDACENEEYIYFDAKKTNNDFKLISMNILKIISEIESRQRKIRDYEIENYNTDLTRFNNLIDHPLKNNLDKFKENLDNYEYNSKISINNLNNFIDLREKKTDLYFSEIGKTAFENTKKIFKKRLRILKKIKKNFSKEISIFNQNLISIYTNSIVSNQIKWSNKKVDDFSIETLQNQILNLNNHLNLGVEEFKILRKEREKNDNFYSRGEILLKYILSLETHINKRIKSISELYSLEKNKFIAAAAVTQIKTTTNISEKEEEYDFFMSIYKSYVILVNRSQIHYDIIKKAIDNKNIFTKKNEIFLLLNNEKLCLKKLQELEKQRRRDSEKHFRKIKKNYKIKTNSNGETNGEKIKNIQEKQTNINELLKKLFKFYEERNFNDAFFSERGKIILENIIKIQKKRVLDIKSLNNWVLKKKK